MGAIEDAQWQAFRAAYSAEWDRAKAEGVSHGECLKRAEQAAFRARQKEALNTCQLGVMIPDSTETALELRAKAEGLTKSQLVRRWISEGLAKPIPYKKPRRKR